jgi:hypothetical protein
LVPATLIYSNKLFFMKRTFLVNAHSLLASTLALTLACTSCQKVDVPPAADGGKGQALIEKAAGNKPGTVPPVNLRVTISDDAGNKIKSDGNGDYTNGLDGVSAYLDQYGNLQFDSNSGMSRRSGPALRQLNFYFDSPITGYSATIPATNPNGNYRMVTWLYGQMPIQALSVGGTETGIGLGGGFSSQVSSSTDWNFNLRYGVEQNNATLNFVTVTHPDADHWIMTGEVTSPVAALKTNGTLTGYYYLPFSFTFTRQ